MKVVVVGAGYVGLVAGACLADIGHSVTCVEKETTRLDRLLAGDVPIFEPGLSELVAVNVAAGRLTFTAQLAKAVVGAEIVFIAVGTPPRATDGSADLTDVYAVAHEVGQVASGNLIVVVKSTVPVGTCEEIELILQTERPEDGRRLAVASNPEFLRQGSAISDFMRPDRIVFGADQPWVAQKLEALYAAPQFAGVPRLLTSRRSAELLKYAANAFLAMKITFINEIADICEASGGNIEEVSDGIGLDSRIGPRFLRAGPGYGGSCFPKDTAALAMMGRDHGQPLKLVEATIAVNEERKLAMARKIIAACDGDVRGKTIAILGLTFKPNTDDMRAAPSVDIIRRLLEAGAAIKAYDPAGMSLAKHVLQEVSFAESAREAVRDAICLVIVTEWAEFRDLDLKLLRSEMASGRLVDLRNVIKPAAAVAAGFMYWGIGKPEHSIADDGSEPELDSVTGVLA